jgi:hypothetical protein
LAEKGNNAVKHIYRQFIVLDITTYSSKLDRSVCLIEWYRIIPYVNHPGVLSRMCADFVHDQRYYHAGKKAAERARERAREEERLNERARARAMERARKRDEARARKRARAEERARRRGERTLQREANVAGARPRWYQRLANVFKLWRTRPN